MPKSVVRVMKEESICRRPGLGSRERVFGPSPIYANLTLMMDISRKTTASMMVNWKRLFSTPRRVRKLAWALPKRPEPVSRTCKRITSTRVMDTSI